jgi:hypothetical protein
MGNITTGIGVAYLLTILKGAMIMGYKKFQVHADVLCMLFAFVKKESKDIYPALFGTSQIYFVIAQLLTSSGQIIHA